MLGRFFDLWCQQEASLGISGTIEIPILLFYNTSMTAFTFMIRDINVIFFASIAELCATARQLSCGSLQHSDQ